MTSCDNAGAEARTGQLDRALAERLVSAVFQVDRAQTPSDLGAANRALGRALQESDRAGVPLSVLSRTTGLSAAEVRDLLTSRWTN